MLRKELSCLMLLSLSLSLKGLHGVHEFRLHHHIQDGTKGKGRAHHVATGRRTGRKR